MNLEGLRSRIVYKAFDAAMTASLRPQGGFVTHVRRLLRLRSSNYDRVAALVNLFDAVVPGAAKRAFKCLFRFEGLPFPQAHVSLLDYGSASTVYCVDVGGARSVLKVFRDSLGRNLPSLVKIARHGQEQYESVAAWYDGPWSPVVPTVFLVLCGPILRRPSAGCVQPFIEGEIKDFFADFTDDGILELVAIHEDLRQQVVHFCDRTLRIHSEQGICLDLLGRRNLMVVGGGTAPRLALIDCGVFDLSATGSLRPDLAARTREQLLRLERLASRLSVGLCEPRPQEDCVHGRIDT